jgi:NADH dehydrogenase
MSLVGGTGDDVATRVVLVGGGYVSLHAYRELAHRLRRELRRGVVEIVVLTADEAHSFHGFTGEVLAGMLPFDVTRTPLDRAMPRATVVHADVTHVDAVGRVVSYVDLRTGASRELGYDELVVGVGGREPLATVPGLAEHGRALRVTGGIRALHELLREAVVAGTPTVVVAGGGLAGAELAAAIADGGQGRTRVVLVHSGDRLVPELAADFPRLGRYAETQLRRLDVDLRLAARIVAVAPDHVRLSDGTAIPCTIVLGTIGQRAVTLPGLDRLSRDPAGRLLTAEDLSVCPGVWAAGDAALVQHPVTNDPVPANALWAIKAGEHVGRNVARTLLGRPTTRFRYRGLGQAASFGIGRSAAELYGISFTGWPAWGLRLVFFLRFMPSRRNAWLTLRNTAAALRGRRPGFAEAVGGPQPSDAEPGMAA